MRTRKLKRLWWLGAMLLSACASTPAPPPCECQKALDELTQRTELYLAALKDKGVLRQQLDACEERK